MTKEAILEKNGRELSSGQVHITATSALNAMEEYAKQQAIAFAKSIILNVWGIHNNLSGSPYISDEMAYNQFIESQNNNK